MSACGFPSEVVEGIKDSVDCNLYFFGHGVSLGAMYAILSISAAVLIAAYVIMNTVFKIKKS